MDVLKELHKINEQRCIDGFGMTVYEWSLPTWGNAMAGEAGEACNVIKKIYRGDFDNNVNAGKQQLANELADVIVYIDLMATRENINLEQAIIDKFNAVSDKVGSSIKLKQ